MALTDTELLRVAAIEAKLNQLQTASNNLATRKELKNLLALLENTLTEIREDLTQIELTGSGNALADHEVDLVAHENIFIGTSAGASDAGKPIKTGADGKIDASLMGDAGVSDHGDLTGLADDDHTQYHTDARGDVRYYTKSEYLTSSAGVADAGKPVILSASGVFDSTLIPGGSAGDHGLLGGLSDDDHPQYIHLNKASQTLLQDLLVSTGTTIDGRDISADGATLDTISGSFVSSVNSRTGAVSLVASDAPAGIGADSIQWGTGATSVEAGGIAIGTNASAAVGGYSVAIGYGSKGWGLNATAVGDGAQATAQSATSVGGGSNASAVQSVALGSSSDAQGINGVAIGHDSFIGPTATGGVALGRTADVRAADAIAIGNASIAYGTSSIALGHSATTASYTNALAIGDTATVTANNQAQLGTAAQPLDLVLYGTLVTPSTIDGRDVSVDGTVQDSHIADATVHFTEASIDHTHIQNIGTKTHAQIDTAVAASTAHIADSTIHFTQASIDHGSISGLSDDDHTGYILAAGTRGLSNTWNANERITSASGIFNIGNALTSSHNLTTGSIGTGGSLEVDGDTWTDGQFFAASGLIGTPGYAFAGDGDTGLFNSAANIAVITGAGGAVATFNGNTGATTFAGTANFVGGRLYIDSSSGFTAASSSAPAWVFQNQDSVQDVRLVGSADAAGEVAARIGTKYTDAQGGKSATLLSIGTDNDAAAASTVSKAEFYGDGRVELGLNSEITTASGVDKLLSLSHRINQSGTAAYTAIQANITETALGSSTSNLIDLQVASSSKFRVNNAGKIVLPLATALIDTGTGSGLAIGIETSSALRDLWVHDIRVSSDYTGATTMNFGAGFTGLQMIKTYLISWSSATSTPNGNIDLGLSRFEPGILSINSTNGSTAGLFLSATNQSIFAATATSPLTLGGSGTPSWPNTTNSGVYSSGQIEFDGNAYFDADLTVGSGLTTARGNIRGGDFAVDGGGAGINMHLHSYVSANLALTLMNDHTSSAGGSSGLLIKNGAPNDGSFAAGAIVTSQTTWTTNYGSSSYGIFGSNLFGISSGHYIGWTGSNGSIGGSLYDTAMIREAAGVVRINSGPGGLGTSATWLGSLAASGIYATQNQPLQLGSPSGILFTSHSLTKDDVFVTSKFEADGQAWFDADATFMGGANMKGFTTTAADPTTTEYPAAKDWGFHKNTNSNNLYLVFNDGGTIKKVTLS